MRILVAEDDDRLARAVAAGLRRRGMTVDVALDGDDALGKLAACGYDVVVLDRDLPGTGGDDICRTLAVLALAGPRVAARGFRLAHGADPPPGLAGLSDWQAFAALWNCGDSASMPDGRVNEPLAAGSGKAGSP
jgi:hypothetical protein